MRRRRCPEHKKLLGKYAAAPYQGLTWMWLCPVKGCKHVEYSYRSVRSTF